MKLGRLLWGGFQSLDIQVRLLHRSCREARKKPSSGFKHLQSRPLGPLQVTVCLPQWNPFFIWQFIGDITYNPIYNWCLGPTREYPSMLKNQAFTFTSRVLPQGGSKPLCLSCRCLEWRVHLPPSNGTPPSEIRVLIRPYWGKPMVNKPGF